MQAILQLDQIEGVGGLTSEFGLYGAEKLVAAFEAMGNLPKAIELLTTMGENRVGVTAGNLFDRWLRDRAHLARLHRKAGHETEARTIEVHLLKLLAFADPDYPLLQELRSRPY